MFNSFSSYPPIRCVCVLLCLLGVAACGGSGSGGSSPKTGHLHGGAIQGTEMALKGEVSAVSGSFFSIDGVGAQAVFSNPVAVAGDGTNLYVADSMSHVIRKVVVATGVTTTLAGKSGSSGNFDGKGADARFSVPAGIVSDGTYLYITDKGNRTIRKLTIATGAVTTLAGAAENVGSVDGVGSAASFRLPEGIASDGNNLYVSDPEENTIRKVVIATGEVSTFAGSSNVQGGNVDGIGSAASFYHPRGIASDGVNLYVCDSGNRSIRKIIIATGQVSTLFSDTQSGSYVYGFTEPLGLSVNGENLYVTDYYTHSVYRVAIATGERSVLAGLANGLQGSEDGPGLMASFYRPVGITNDGVNFYVADSGNNSIRKIVMATGVVSTLAGYSEDGFFFAQQITTDGANLYIANFSIIQKRVIATGVVTSLAVFDARLMRNMELRFPRIDGITSDATNIYVSEGSSNSIFKVAIATGAITILAGSSDSIGAVDGVGIGAEFSRLGGITTDGTNLYVVDGGAIRKIVIATGVVTTLVGTSDISGSADGVGAAAGFARPLGITTDGVNLYVTDTYNHNIRKVVIATRTVTTLAGSAGVEGSADGVGVAASFAGPAGITSDGLNLYISDKENHNVRKLVIATGEVTTLAGKANITGAENGLGTAATFHGPVGITTDGVDLFIADSVNYAVRKIH